MIEIGGISVALRTRSLAFRHLLEDRYRDFIDNSIVPRGFDAKFEIELREPDSGTSPDADLLVRRVDGIWMFDRGDFQATWNPVTGHGEIVQPESPYAVDSVLRIVHSILLAEKDGLLIHAASVIRDGWSYLFAGVSGAGKTTICRLAPEDVTLLTDEVSYVRREISGYQSYGTPFAGELAKGGENRSAPLAAIFLLKQGSENRIEPVKAAEAARSIMRNILFFSDDHRLVETVFHSACQLIESVPVHTLIFTPDRRVWEIIGKTGGLHQ